LRIHENKQSLLPFRFTEIVIDILRDHIEATLDVDKIFRPWVTSRLPLFQLSKGPNVPRQLCPINRIRRILGVVPNVLQATLKSRQLRLQFGIFRMEIPPIPRLIIRREDNELELKLDMPSLGIDRKGMGITPLQDFGERGHAPVHLLDDQHLVNQGIIIGEPASPGRSCRHVIKLPRSISKQGPSGLASSRVGSVHDADRRGSISRLCGGMGVPLQGPVVSHSCPKVAFILSNRAWRFTGVEPSLNFVEIGSGSLPKAKVIRYGAHFAKKSAVIGMPLLRVLAIPSSCNRAGLLITFAEVRFRTSVSMKPLLDSVEPLRAVKDSIALKMHCSS